MGAEEEAGKVEGEEVEEEVGQRMVVRGGEREGRSEGVVVGGVKVGEVGWLGGMEEEAVDVVGQDLSMLVHGHVSREARGMEPTSRITKARTTPVAMLQGMGSVVVTFSALCICKTSVNRYSIPPCSTTPSRTFSTLKPTILYHCGDFLDFETFAPPVLVGKPDAPCVLKLTARLGRTESKTRNNVDGTSQNRAFMPSVPSISTRKGGCESTRVLHVM